LDLWKWLDELVECRTNIDYQWIRGHNGDEGNEKADLLANEAITKNSLNQ
jgi:ribonuclease HI